MSPNPTMARLPRLVVPNQSHHIIQSGIDRQAIFRDSDDYIVFLGWVREAARQFKLAIHAYVLMPDHFHLLATPSDDTGLARMMQWIGRKYVPYFNAKYQRVGTLWQGRYKATVIDAEKYLIACSRYIELNPVRAGLVAEPRDYPWSSCSHHVGAQPSPLITDHSIYWALGNTPFEREAVYQRILEQKPGIEEVAALTDAAVKGWALGSDLFKTGLEKQAKRRVSPAKRGRPPKQKLATTFSSD